MRFFKRVVEFWLHVIGLTDNPQQPLEYPSNSLTVGSSGQPRVPSLPHDNPKKDCLHGPKSRGCWTTGFDITSDYEYEWPNTGVTRNYTLVLTNEYIHPDGYNVSRMLINGTYPGPTIEANWGDWIQITVVNNLKNHNGTAIHWHGIRQLNTITEDGVAGVTQCPVPPGYNYTYKWQATQYGVSWYHSHFSLQYPDGLVGPLKIHGPSSGNYDVDLGPVLVTDWLHKDAFELFQLELLGRPPTPDTNLLNGKGPYYCCASLDPQCTGEKQSFTEFVFKENTTYKMSLVNTAVSTHFTFWIDNHDFWVVASDFVPIVPYKNDTLNIAIGQRYDIVIEAKKQTDSLASRNFWIHARDCANVGGRSTLGIIRYDAENKEYPLSPHPSRLCHGCLDEMDANLVPVVERKVGPSVVSYDKSNSLEVALQGYPDTENRNSVLHKWILKDSSFYIDWTQPSLSLITVADGKSWDNPFPDKYVPVFLNYTQESWVYFLIEGNFTQHDQKAYKKQAPVAHPIHVHGHDFVILANGNTTFDPKIHKLNLNNPPRRDTALLPVTGFLLIAFQINNPGTWLMHCHIAWHASGGLALQFVEKQNEIVPLMTKANVYKQYYDTCAVWGAYYRVFNEKFNLTMEDSGV